MRQARFSSRAGKQGHRVHITIAIIALLVIMLIPGCGNEKDILTDDPGKRVNESQVRVDDWALPSGMSTEDSGRYGAGHTNKGVVKAVPVEKAVTVMKEVAPEAAAGNIGFSAGGAKDVNNFRENIRNNYLPLPTDITYEGLFYDYYFDTGEQEACQKLFCPSYSYAVTTDPFSDETEYYLAVGLNSGLKESDFHRKKLNLVIVLDISGSMRSPFNRYYYDRFGNRVELDEPEENSERSKIEIATESVVALLNHLEDDDRFGMVLFNNSAFLAKPLNPVGTTDMQAIKDHILEISAGGGTHMSAGMSMGTDLFEEVLDFNPEEYENRIIFLTDAMPNTGETSEHGLLGMTKKNAGDRLYTTFIGIGVDFNTELIEHITKIRGANYYSVHSSKQFKERMDEEFEYMVTPLVFNLELNLEAEGWEIEFRNMKLKRLNGSE